MSIKSPFSMSQFFPFPLFLLVSRCSCRGGGQLRRGLSQSKDSDRGAIRALHLDPHPGEAVIALFFTTTPHPHRHPHPPQPSQPRLPVCPPAKSLLWQSLRTTPRDEMRTETNIGSDTAWQRTIPKSDSETDMTAMTGS